MLFHVANTMIDTKQSENTENSGLKFGATVSLAVVVGLLVSCIPLVIWKRKKTGQQGKTCSNANQKFKGFSNN